MQTFVQFWLQFFPKWIPQDTGVDVMMLLDSSSSVQMSDFNKGKKGIQVRSFNIVIWKAHGLPKYNSAAYRPS